MTLYLREVNDRAWKFYSVTPEKIIRLKILIDSNPILEDITEFCLDSYEMNFFKPKPTISPIPHEYAYHINVWTHVVYTRRIFSIHQRQNQHCHEYSFSISYRNAQAVFYTSRNVFWVSEWGLMGDFLRGLELSDD